MHSANFINYNLILKLAVRESITGLCNDSEKTLSLLKKFNQQNKFDNSDYLKFAVFSVFRKLFALLKNEICLASNSNCKFKLLTLLKNDSSDQVIDVLQRYILKLKLNNSSLILKNDFDKETKKFKNKQWNYIEVMPKCDQIKKYPVPKIVPPLNRQEVEECSSLTSPSNRFSKELFDSSRSVNFNKKSLNYSKLIDGNTNLNESTLLELDNNLKSLKIKETINLCELNQTKIDNVVSIEKFSKEVQTSFDNLKEKVINESIKFDENLKSLQTTKSEDNSSYNFSKLLKSDSTATNSSMVLSDFSAGQLTTQNANHNLISVNIDGSINNRNFTEFPATPNRFTQNKFTKALKGNKQHYCQETITSNFKKRTMFPSNYEEYGISIHEDRLNKKNNYTPKRPHIIEYEENCSMLNEFSSLSSKSIVLVAKEVSLLTSFDSSNTCKKRLEYEKYQKLILSAEEKVKKLDTSEEIIELIKSPKSSSKNIRFSTTNESHLIKNTKVNSVEEEDEESTLNQVSPLPTTG